MKNIKSFPIRIKKIGKGKGRPSKKEYAMSAIASYIINTPEFKQEFKQKMKEQINYFIRYGEFKK